MQKAAEFFEDEENEGIKRNVENKQSIVNLMMLLTSHQMQHQHQYITMKNRTFSSKRDPMLLTAS
jgi:hypothetical protein